MQIIVGVTIYQLPFLWIMLQDFLTQSSYKHQHHIYIQKYIY